MSYYLTTPDIKIRFYGYKLPINCLYGIFQNIPFLVSDYPMIDKYLPYICIYNRTTNIWSVAKKRENPQLFIYVIEILHKLNLYGDVTDSYPATTKKCISFPKITGNSSEKKYTQKELKEKYKLYDEITNKSVPQIHQDTNTFCTKHIEPSIQLQIEKERRELMYKQLLSGSLSPYSKDTDLTKHKLTSTHDSREGTYRKLSQNMGTPAHIEYLHRSSGKRNKRWCLHYETFNSGYEKCGCPKCIFYLLKCAGSSHCDYYEEYVYIEKRISYGLCKCWEIPESELCEFLEEFDESQYKIFSTEEYYKKYRY